MSAGGTDATAALIIRTSVFLRLSTSIRRFCGDAAHKLILNNTICGVNGMENTEKLRQWINESERIVFFGGAGVSTESGIPDFRSVDGLYNQKYSDPPEEILSANYFEAFPDKFYKFYRDKLNISGAEPNAAHYALAGLEREGKLSAVITQNIDGLHQAAGSRNVLELHGSLLRNYCTKCGRHYDYEHMLSFSGVPTCRCGGIIRPDIVLYGENLDFRILNRSAELIKDADMLIIGGTSLVVYPAAGLIDYYTGHRLVLINRDATSRDNAADLVIRGNIGEVFSSL